MSLMMHLNPILENVKYLKQFLPHTISLSRTQKVVVVSVTASMALLGVLARYMRRRRQVVDPKKFKRNFGKRARASGIRSPNADMMSQASSGRRSNAYSGYSDRGTVRQSSVLGGGSERASVASGSLVSGGILPEAGDTVHLTPQQLGVM
ncbi:PREDICTED: mitoguardin-like, partial [Nicrophorus vespilloides]